MDIDFVVAQKYIFYFKEDKKEKALQLKQLANSSIASYNLGDAFELKLLIKRIRFIEMQKVELEKEIERILSELHSPITSIPGIGNVLGATILTVLAIYAMLCILLLPPRIFPALLSNLTFPKRKNKANTITWLSPMV